MVVYSDAKTLRSVLERDKAPEFSTTMQIAMNKADFSKSVVTVIDLSVQTKITVQGPGGFNPLGGGGAVNFKSGEYKIQEMSISKDMKVREVTSFSDPLAAEAAKKESEHNLEMAKQFMPQLKDMLNETNYKTTTSGNMLVVEANMTSAIFIKILKGLK
jgi:hypothetical protein